MPVFDFSTGMLTPEDAQVIIEASKGKPLLDRSESAWQTHNAHYFLDTLANRVVTGMRTGDNWMAPTGMILVVNALDVALRIKESFDDRCQHGEEAGRPVDYSPPFNPPPGQYLSWQAEADFGVIPPMMEGHPSFGIWVARKADGFYGVDFAVCFSPSEQFPCGMNATLYGPYSSSGTALISIDTGTDYKSRLNEDDRASHVCSASWSGTVKGKPVTFALNGAVENPGRTQTHLMIASVTQVPAA